MSKKKKIIISIISIVVVLAIVGGSIAAHTLRFAKDEGDTEELFLKNVESIGYENTIDTAIPQTELYDVINSHFNSELPDGKTEKKAIILGYDGCRADVIKYTQENSAINKLLDDGAELKLSYCGGVNYPEKNTQDTSTAPGWCSILTGQWADVHGITGNGIPKSLDTKTIMTTLTENKVIDSASFITRWKGHFENNDSTYINEKAYCEENNLNVSFNRCKNDEESHAFTLNEVKKDACSDFIFVIYEHTDATGHDYGFTINNPKYREAFAQEDAYALEVIEAIEKRETYDTEDWLIIITSDHGGIGTDHGNDSIQERMTFIVANKDY